MRAITLLAAILALMAGAASAAPAGQPAPVSVGDFFFCDASAPPGSCTTTIAVGETVIWAYSSGTEGHTVTDCGVSCDSPTESPAFDSGAMQPGDTFAFTFAAPGTYLYRCTFHPDAMRARVVVQPAATPSAAVNPSPAATPSAATTTTPGATLRPSATPAPTPAASEDGGGFPTWGIIAIGAGVIVVLLAGAALALRRRG